MDRVLRIHFLEISSTVEGDRGFMAVIKREKWLRCCGRRARVEINIKSVTTKRIWKAAMPNKSVRVKPVFTKLSLNKKIYPFHIPMLGKPYKKSHVTYPRLARDTWCACRMYVRLPNGRRKSMREMHRLQTVAGNDLSKESPPCELICSLRGRPPTALRKKIALLMVGGTAIVT